MQCKDVEAVVEQEGLAPVPQELSAHLAECRVCRDYLADLTSIVDVARKMPSEIAPPDRVWISLRAQLELEGIIKEPAFPPAAERVSWWHGFGDLFRGRTLATATVGLLIVAAGALQLRQPAEPPAKNPPSISSPGWQISFQQTAIVLNQQEVDLRNMHLTSTSPVDASLEQNLQQVDGFIADCERRVNEAPQDDLAREYLSDAYQQKAELLSAMMDRGRSVN